MSRFKGVLFDLDGTLIDTAPDLVASLNASLTKAGHKQHSLSDMRVSASYGSMRMLKHAEPNLDESEYLELQKHFLDHYQIINGLNSRIFTHIDKLLQKLIALEFKLGVVTNKPAKYTRPLLDKLNLTSKFDVIISGDTCSVAKPNPAPLLLAADLIGLDPSELIYIGDSEFDMLAAKNANMYSVLALWGYSTHDNSSWDVDHRIKTPIDILFDKTI